MSIFTQAAVPGFIFLHLAPSQTSDGPSDVWSHSVVPIPPSYDDAQSSVFQLFTCLSPTTSAITLKGLIALQNSERHWCPIRLQDWPALVPAVYTHIGAFVERIEATPSEIPPSPNKLTPQPPPPVQTTTTLTVDPAIGSTVTEDGPVCLNWGIPSPVRLIPLRWTRALEGNAMYFMPLCTEAEFFIQLPNSFQQAHDRIQFLVHNSPLTQHWPKQVCLRINRLRLFRYARPDNFRSPTFNASYTTLFSNRCARRSWHNIPVLWDTEGGDEQLREAVQDLKMQPDAILGFTYV